MQEVGIYEVKTNIGQLLERVEKGEEILITRRGKAVARLLPLADQFNRQAALDAVQHIREMRRGVTLGGLKVKDLISEGRM